MTGINEMRTGIHGMGKKEIYGIWERVRYGGLFGFREEICACEMLCGWIIKDLQRLQRRNSSEKLKAKTGKRRVWERV